MDRGFFFHFYLFAASFRKRREKKEEKKEEEKKSMPESWHQARSQVFTRAAFTLRSHTDAAMIVLSAINPQLSKWTWSRPGRDQNKALRASSADNKFAL